MIEKKKGSFVGESIENKRTKDLIQKRIPALGLVRPKQKEQMQYAKYLKKQTSGLEYEQKKFGTKKLESLNYLNEKQEIKGEDKENLEMNRQKKRIILKQEQIWKTKGDHGQQMERSQKLRDTLKHFHSSINNQNKTFESIKIKQL